MPSDLQARSGEDRHAACRYGMLSPGMSIPAHADLADESAWSPSVVHSCLWEPSEPWPPALARRWGGAVEPDRDCAVCACWKPIIALPVPSPRGRW